MADRTPRTDACPRCTLAEREKAARDAVLNAFAYAIAYGETQEDVTPAYMAAVSRLKKACALLAAIEKEKKRAKK